MDIWVLLTPLNHLGSIWYHSEPLEVPIPQTSFLVGIFFQQTCSSRTCVMIISAMIQAWVIEYIISSFYKNATSKILLSHWGGKCAILWLLSWPIPVFRLLWDFPRFSCEITWLPSTPLLAINKMFEVFARLSSTEGAFQNRPFKIYKSALENHRNRNLDFSESSMTQLRRS